MISRALVFHLALGFGALAGGCSSTSSPAQTQATPEPDAAPRVFVEGLLFDAPPGWPSAQGMNPAEASFGVLATRAGARHVSSFGALTTADVAARLPTAEANAAVPDDPLADYQLEITSHVMESDRVRLRLDLHLGDKEATTTVVTADKQLLVVGTEVTIEDRRFTLLVRPHIVRSDGDLQALLDQKREALLDEKARVAPAR
ncbi:MAG: hypothetical protein KF894_18640 [Labilithrix sp.]|nr:hypothetical protein [Labilithrix sp.]